MEVHPLNACGPKKFQYASMLELPELSKIKKRARLNGSGIQRCTLQRSGKLGCLHGVRAALKRRFDEPVFAIVALVHNIDLRCVGICKNKEIMANHVHLENRFVNIHGL